MNVWRMFTHDADRDGAIAWIRRSGRIAIGWGRIGDVRKYRSQWEIKEAIRDNYPVPPYRNNAHLGAPSLWSFCHEIQKGDLVILSGSTPRTLVVQVLGNYEHVEGESPLEGNFQNQRRVQVTALDPDEVWFAAGQAPGTQRYQTLIKCAYPVTLGEE
jgi:predicted Mrr-cat superfamily restriction endonuclease